LQFDDLGDKYNFKDVIKFVDSAETGF